MRKDNQDDKIYRLYKPFANKLKQFELMDSFAAIWAYAMKAVQPHRFLAKDIDTLTPSSTFHPFELEFLLREIILNAIVGRKASLSLKRENDRSEVIRRLRKLDDEIYDIYQPDIFLEVYRKAHQQFKWQTSFHQSVLFRYYKIFNSEGLADMVEHVFNLKPIELYLTGFFLGSHFFKYCALWNHFEVENPPITKQVFNTFLQHFSKPLDELVAEISNKREMNSKIFYSYNPLSAYPIIREGNRIICPIPVLLIWQVTSGIYYQIISSKTKPKGFEVAFGTAFENYVGEVLNLVNTPTVSTIYPQAKYKVGKNEKDTADWIVEDGEALLFIECKTKRVTLEAKTNIGVEDTIDDLSKNPLGNELGKMADFILQLYKTYLDYENNFYPEHLKHKADKRVFLMILTLEDWYLDQPLAFPLQKEVRKRVEEKFKLENLDLSLLERVPYTVESINGFEFDFQIINSLGIKKFLTTSTEEKFAIRKKFDVKMLFEGEFRKLFTSKLQIQKL